EHMNTTWNLDKLYKGFDTEGFQTDVTKFEATIDELKHFNFQGYTQKEKQLETYLRESIELMMLASKLFHYASLIQATDSTNLPALKYLNRFQMKMTDLTVVESKFKKWLKDYPNIDQDFAKNDFLKEHEFVLRETIRDAAHLFDDKTETLIAKLKQTGSTAWERLQALLTSTLEVDLEGKEVTLSEVRNMAYSEDPEVRRKAFEAEIAAYKKIEKPIAYAINGIKGEVNTLLEERGYASVLDFTLEQNRLRRDTLMVMLETMEEYLPVFRNYLKRKAALLGHSNGLPFYDLFAPMGKSQKKFTIPEANEYILKNFGTFSPRLHEMASRAFTDGWIDYLPKKGKVGGAFCANLLPIKESRVLANFDGAFGDVITLSHELGHAYHGEAIFGESPLNADYSMPVAETASTFCETIVNKAAFKDATSDDERIFLLESSLQDSTQVIVDILSRYYFESALMEGRKQTLFDETELKTMMLDAQKRAYGDGLDPEKLHPYMWVCKSHYYSGNLSFYNFPYAFGLLFAKGLYAKYLIDKNHFVPLYDKLLASTGKSMAEDTAKIADIDITQKAFWQGSLELLKEDIDLFMRLTEK
ncbi:MAG: M3 family oligoendopeptidase, partial [Candidatus Izemoplasmatales bacterium]|nr:M3 family oligoendopeptidase [Candidatus Izemoplasmatales bacterium]